MNASVYYDILEENYVLREFVPFLVLSIFIFIGLVMSVYLVKERAWATLRRRSFLMLMFLVLPSVFLGFLVFERNQCLEWARNGNFSIVEGTVTKFKPMPYSGHQMESFEVDGIRFEYSDFNLNSGGFNNTTSHGGPIREGLSVRIAYNSGRILKIEHVEK